MSSKQELAVSPRLVLKWGEYSIEVDAHWFLIGLRPNASLQLISPLERNRWSTVLEFKQREDGFSVKALELAQPIRINCCELTAIAKEEFIPMVEPRSPEAAKMSAPSQPNDMLLLTNSSRSNEAEIGEQPNFAAHKLAQLKTLHVSCQDAYALAFSQADEQKIQQLTSSYTFGPLTFLIEDDECWVICDEGTVAINGVALAHQQLYVEDRIVWQSHCWAVVGTGPKRAPAGGAKLEISDQRVASRPVRQLLPAPSAVISKATTTRAIEPAAPHENAQAQTITPKTSAQDVEAQVEAEELDLFRSRLQAWLSWAPSDRTSDPEQQVEDDDSELVLALSRNKHSWRERSAQVGPKLLSKPAIQSLLRNPSRLARFQRVHAGQVLAFLLGFAGGATLLSLIVWLAW